MRFGIERSGVFGLYHKISIRVVIVLAVFAVVVVAIFAVVVVAAVGVAVRA